MTRFGESIEIERPPEDVWRAIGAPERWFDGYLETRARSPDYPGHGTRDDHLYRTRTKEEVAVRVTRSEAPNVLEEDQEGKTFSRHLRYHLTPSATGTLPRVEADVSFKGLGKLASRSPRATSRSAGRRRSRSSRRQRRPGVVPARDRSRPGRGGGLGARRLARAARAPRVSRSSRAEAPGSRSSRVAGSSARTGWPNSGHASLAAAERLAGGLAASRADGGLMHSL
jgi:uncharacterized protein YndB with AHSA1/START domain